MDVIEQLKAISQSIDLQIRLQKIKEQAIINNAEVAQGLDYDCINRIEGRIAGLEAAKSLVELCITLNK
jgi:hypothetical protein